MTQSTSEKLALFQNAISNSKIFVKDLQLGNLGFENIGGQNYLTLSNSQSAKKVFSATPQAIKSLSKLLQIESLFNSLESSIGKENASKILNVIKVALSKNKRQVRVVLNFDLKMIVDIIEKPVEFLAPSQFLEIIESKISSKSEIINYGVSGQGAQQITIKNSDWGFKIEGKKDEEFNMGLLFENSPVTGTSIMPYYYRLVCTNGMVSGRGIDSFAMKLNGSKESEVIEFIKGVNGIGPNSIDIDAFSQRVKFMDSQLASFREVKFFKEKSAEYSTSLNVANEEKAFLNQRLDDFFPTVEIQTRYFKKGYDLENYSPKHLSNIKSNITTWDLLNAVTDFASHDYGFGINQSNIIKLQGQAGEYMSKKHFDTEYLMPQF